MPVKINASARLKAVAASEVQAARGDQQQAIKYLESLGFTGLQPKRDVEDLMSFSFEDCDLTHLSKALGAPKKSKGNSLRYKVGTDGVIALYVAKKLVYVRNSTAKKR